jgi:hypothetical protein
MSDPPERTANDRPLRRSILGRVSTYVLGLALGGVLLWWVGRAVWSAYQEYRQANQGAEDAAPIGYVGVSLRKTYNDKPPRFFDTSGGRKRLWAAKGPDGQPEFYDVADASFAVEKVSGGFGRDSIPGIDYPLFEQPNSSRSRNFRDQQEFYALTLADGARAYPRDLLRKIQVVNDEGGGVPFVIVFDSQHQIAQFYDRRVDGRPLTFGTTGYSLGDSDDPILGRPMLYDRKTKSLWLPEPKSLVCVSGPHKGVELPTALRPERTTWSNWVALHPQTVVLIGSDRDNDRRPIPSE